MGRLLHMFKPNPKPVSEVETFDFEGQMYYVLGYCESLQHAQRINEVKELVSQLNALVSGWPDG